jgi:hypothetical protein
VERALWGLAIGLTPDGVIAPGQAPDPPADSVLRARQGAGVSLGPTVVLRRSNVGAPRVVVLGPQPMGLSIVQASVIGLLALAFVALWGASRPAPSAVGATPPPVQSGLATVATPNAQAAPRVRPDRARTAGTGKARRVARPASSANASPGEPGAREAAELLASTPRRRRDGLQ